MEEPEVLPAPAKRRRVNVVSLKNIDETPSENLGKTASSCPELTPKNSNNVTPL